MYLYLRVVIEEDAAAHVHVVESGDGAQMPQLAPVSGRYALLRPRPRLRRLSLAR